MFKSAKRWTSALLTIVATLISSIGLAIEPSQAQPPNAGQLLEMYDHDGMDEGARKEFEFTVLQIADGFGWANAELNGRKMPRLYCALSKSALTGPQLVSILRRAIAEEPPLTYPLSNQPLGLALLISLKRAFPCPTTSETQATADVCAGRTIYINPSLVTRRPHFSEDQYIRIMANPTLTPQERQYFRQLMMEQDQPIQMPYRGGTVLISPNDPCTQQYTGPN